MLAFVIHNQYSFCDALLWRTKHDFSSKQMHELLCNATTEIRRLMMLSHYAAQVLIFELLLVHLIDYSAYPQKTKLSSAIKNISAL